MKKFINNKVSFDYINDQGQLTTICKTVSHPARAEVYKHEPISKASKLFKYDIKMKSIH